MSLRFYMDHHVPAAITEALRERGIDCLTAFDDQRNRAPDTDLLQRATDLGRVLVSLDVDLLVITSEHQRVGRAFAD